MSKTKLSSLMPDPKNANRGTIRGRKVLDESLRKYGAGRSILVDKHGRIIAGNKTAEIAEEIGLDDVIMVQTDGHQLVAVQRTDLDLDDENARMLAYYDNRSGQLDLEWDAEQLQADMLAGVELGGLFDDDELKDILGNLAAEPPDDPGAQIDRAEELREQWGVELGQLWRIPSKTAQGEHRIVCGDCTDREVVEKVMGGEKADTLVSDPPYGIGYEYDSHDDSDSEENLTLVKTAFLNAGLAAMVWTCGMMNLSRDLSWNSGAKVVIWHKGFSASGNGLGGASTIEPVLVVGVKNGTLPNDYLYFPTDRVEGLRDLHSCPKPVGLYEHLIGHLAGAIIYDPFLGSGTTLVACERLAHLGRGVEISPAYVAVSLQRLADMGLSPESVEVQ